MGKLADLFYRWKESKRFLGKGESDLDNISKLIPNREAWEKRKEIIRNGILRGANLDPLPEKTPLHPVIHSSREYEGYKVENVYFESIPGFYVTGSLYQPLDPPKSLPLLLKPHGHLKNKRYKEDNQTLSAMFARMGVRVFTWDMIGYADSTQVKHKISSACTLQTWNST